MYVHLLINQLNYGVDINIIQLYFACVCVRARVCVWKERVDDSYFISRYIS